MQRAGAGSALAMWPQACLSFPTCKMGTLASAWAAGSRTGGPGWASSPGPSAKETLTLLLNNVKCCIRRVACLSQGLILAFWSNPAVAF